MQYRGVIVAVLLTCGSVLGQAPVGPATAVLEGARFGLSAEYGQANTSIAFADGGKERFDFQTANADFSVALTRRWDFFLRLGGCQADHSGFDADWDFMWGGGTRITAFQWHSLSWGVMGQVTNLISRFDPAGESPVLGSASTLSGINELNLVEYLFATGPTWQQGPLSLYGGALLRYTHGQFEVPVGDVCEEIDVNARWDFGGYIGGRFTLFQTDPAQTYWFSRCDLTAEGRFTRDSTGFSVGLLLPFGGAS
jgi:hypothetical protein